MRFRLLSASPFSTGSAACGEFLKCLKKTESEYDMDFLLSKFMHSPNISDSFVKQYGYFLNFLLRSIATDSRFENSVFSPWSIITLLNIAADAASGKTREEITDALWGPDSGGDFRRTFLDIRKLYDKCRNFRNANAICIKKGLDHTVSPDFRKFLKSSYQCRVFSSENMVSEVNAWICEMTNGMIDRIADDSVSDMLFCMMNAVSFESEWKIKHKNSDIHKDYFHNADGTDVLIDMLASSEDYFVENGSCTGVIKPYKDDDFSFMALLPKEEGPRAFDQAIRDADFTNLYNTRRKYEVCTEIPEFSISAEFDLTDACRRAGIRRIFTSEADFSRMTTEKLIAKGIIHKASIDVDRNGTTASGATAMLLFMGEPDFSQIRYVCFDRPFLFAVIHNKTGLPVFTGAVKHIGKKGE